MACRILGLGGTTRAGSSTEKALICALRTAEAAGAHVELLGGDFLADLPMLDPKIAAPSSSQARLIEAVKSADGLILATPGYHGLMSGVMKNALDTFELLRSDVRPYLTGRAVGCIVTAEGAQATGTTLVALRSVIHALRGWPSPFGAALNGGSGLFDEEGKCRDERDAWQLATVATEVVEFANLRARAAEPVIAR